MNSTKTIIYELWNLYIIQDKKLDFEHFQFSENPKKSKVRKYFDIFDVLSKKLLFLISYSDSLY